MFLVFRVSSFEFSSLIIPVMNSDIEKKITLFSFHDVERNGTRLLRDINVVVRHMLQEIFARLLREKNGRRDSSMYIKYAAAILSYPIPYLLANGMAN